MRKTILVVDDDETLLDCYRLLLETEKTIVYTSNNSDDALDIVKTIHDLDLVILDYMMPKLRGDELAKQIFEINPQVKIFFISGYYGAIDQIKSLNVAVYGVFQKPVDPELLERLAETEDYETLAVGSDNSPTINQYSNI